MAKKLTKKAILAQLKTSNLRPDAPDDRDYIYSSSTVGMPRKFDLLQWTAEIENQASSNSCTANAGASACEVWSARAGNKLNFSRFFLYYNEREPYSRLHGVDGGAFMRDICKQLNERGICLEENWPFDLSKVNDKPPENCYTEALKFKVGRYERIPCWDYDLIASAIARGYPVLMGMSLKEPFFNMGDNLEQNLALFEASVYHNKRDVGSHAMLVVGYDLDRRYFLVENSWGDSWGMKGICAIPFDAFGCYTHDVWVFTEFAGYDLPELWKDPTVKPIQIKVPAEVTIKQLKNRPDMPAKPMVIGITGGTAPYTVTVSSNTVEHKALNKAGTKVQGRYTWKPTDSATIDVIETITVTDSAQWKQKVTVPLKYKLLKYVAPVVKPKTTKVPPDEPVPTPEPTPIPVPIIPRKEKKEEKIDHEAIYMILAAVIVALATKVFGFW